MRSKGPGGGSSAQIHQGVGPETANQSETGLGVPENDVEYGGEA